MPHGDLLEERIGNAWYSGTNPPFFCHGQMDTYLVHQLDIVHEGEDVVSTDGSDPIISFTTRDGTVGSRAVIERERIQRI